MKRAVTTGIALWLARVCALLLALFWGAFFVEHLQEWFLRGDGVWPPLPVWIGQILHLAMIVGLVLILFRPVGGAVATIVATVAFFASIGVNRFPAIALLNLLPVVFAFAFWAIAREAKPRTAGGS